jgi:hypothetical protein
MTEVTVLDAGSDDIAGNIASGIEEFGGNSGDLLIRSIRTLNDMSAKKTDVLVLSEDDAIFQGEPKARVACKILLLPGDRVTSGTEPGDTDFFDAECVVTYGMSPKNTITLSSISEESCVLALQRELITIGGDVLERQEIKIKGGLRPNSLLAVYGTLLILGYRISDINR